MTRQLKALSPGAATDRILALRAETAEHMTRAQQRVLDDLAQREARVLERVPEAQRELVESMLAAVSVRVDDSVTHGSMNIPVAVTRDGTVAMAPLRNDFGYEPETSDDG